MGSSSRDPTGEGPCTSSFTCISKVSELSPRTLTGEICSLGLALHLRGELTFLASILSEKWAICSPSPLGAWPPAQSPGELPCISAPGYERASAEPCSQKENRIGVIMVMITGPPPPGPASSCTWRHPPRPLQPEDRSSVQAGEPWACDLCPARLWGDCGNRVTGRMGKFRKEAHLAPAHIMWQCWDVNPARLQNLVRFPTGTPSLQPLSVVISGIEVAGGPCLTWALAGGRGPTCLARSAGRREWQTRGHVACGTAVSLPAPCPCPWLMHCPLPRGAALAV